MSDLDAIEFIENPEPRCPVVLLLDTSYSMSGDPITGLNAGLHVVERELKADRLVSLRVEIAILTFGGEVKVVQDFVTANQFTAPNLHADGNTPMGAAVNRGLDMLRARKDEYKRHGIDYFRPWMFLITDGYPTDSWEAAADRVNHEEQRKGVIFFGVGVEKADMQTLARFSAKRPPLKVKGLAFRELFMWLSKSLGSVSQSRPGEQVSLPPAEWGTVEA